MGLSVGFVGLGIMGAAMAERLLKQGCDVTVHNRTKEKGTHLIASGAHWSDDPAGTARNALSVHSMVSTPDALRAVALGPRGILAGLAPGGIHVDHSTVSPDVTRQLAKEYAAQGKHFIHAPVLGSVSQAIDGSLLLFVGGEDGPAKDVDPILRMLGSRTWRFPRVEQATTVKLLCNSFIAGMIGTLAQAFVLAKKTDVNPSTLLEIIGQSQLSAPTYQTKGRAIIERNFTPRFFVEHLAKDVGLVLDLAHAQHVPMPVAEAMSALIRQAMNAGLAQEDYSSIIKVLERTAGVEVR